MLDEQAVAMGRGCNLGVWKKRAMIKAMMQKKGTGKQQHWKVWSAVDCQNSSLGGLILLRTELNAIFGSQFVFFFSLLLWWSPFTDFWMLSSLHSWENYVWIMMCWSWIIPAHESWLHTSFSNSTFRDLMLVTCQLVMVGDLHHGNPYKEGFPHQLGSQFTSTTQLLCYLYIVEFGLLVLCSFVHEGRLFFFFLQYLLVLSSPWGR